jgi:membrane protease YdiL (CAAX protease family)
MTIEDPKSNKMGSTPDNSGHGSLAKSQAEVHPPIKGVSILGFSPLSRAEKAGKQKSDVIVEYGGAGNLTTDRLAALTAKTTFKGTEPRVVFVRDGSKHSLAVAPGSLGISAVDTTIPGSFEKSQNSPETSLNDFTPWTVRDAWFVTGLFVLFQHILVLSLAMTHVPEMLCVLIALAWKRTGWEALGFRKFNRNALKLGCKLILVFYVINGVHNALLKHFQLSTYGPDLIRSIHTHQTLWWMVPVITVIGPFTEEVLFRGLLFSGFRQRYSWQTAAVISSGLFALSHPGFGAFIPAFAFGCVSAYLYQRTGSIWPSILMHCLINTLGLCAGFVKGLYV